MARTKRNVLDGRLVEAAVKERSATVAKSTRQGDEALLKQMHDFAGADFADRTIDDAYLGDFSAYLQQKLKPSSARGYLERLAALLRLVKRKGLVASIPELDTALPMPDRENADRVFLTKEELQRMRTADCPDESTKRAFLFSCYTGLLKGEVKDLQWDNIRYSGNGLVLARPMENGDGEVRVPLVEPAHDILRSLELEYARLPQEQRDDRVFHLRSNTSIADDLNKWAQSAGISKSINYMTSRHTFATMALRAGVDLYVLSRWCGFSNVGTAQAYAALIGRYPRSDTDALEAAFRV